MKFQREISKPSERHAVRRASLSPVMFLTDEFVGLRCGNCTLERIALTGGSFSFVKDLGNPDPEALDDDCVDKVVRTRPSGRRKTVSTLSLLSVGITALSIVDDARGRRGSEGVFNTRA